MNMSIVSHAVSRALGFRHGVYLDTNAWSELAKSTIPIEPLGQWLKDRCQTLIITRFSIGELSKDDRLAHQVASIIERLDVVFADIGTNDLAGMNRKDVPYELLMRLTPQDNATKDELIKFFQSQQIREAIQGLNMDAEQWKKRIANAVASKQDGCWTWDDFQPTLLDLVKGTCLSSGRDFLESAFLDPNCYVGIKLAFGVVFARYFIAKKRFAPSDYVDFLHCSDMAYFEVVVTESGLCEAITQVRNRMPGSGANNVYTLQWLKTPT